MQTRKKKYYRAFILPLAEHALANDLKERGRKRGIIVYVLVHGGFLTRAFVALDKVVLCVCLLGECSKAKRVRSSIDVSVRVCACVSFCYQVVSLAFIG
jgi:hypothetical protein